MVCIGFEPGAAEWKVHLNPLRHTQSLRSLRRKKVCGIETSEADKNTFPLVAKYFPSPQNFCEDFMICIFRFHEIL